MSTWRFRVYWTTCVGSMTLRSEPEPLGRVIGIHHRSPLSAADRLSFDLRKVPDEQGAVPAAGDELSAIRSELQPEHPVQMAIEDGNSLVRRKVDQEDLRARLHRIAAVGDCERLAIGRERQGMTAFHGAV